MAKYLLAEEGINWIAIVALLTFVIVFVMVIVMAFGRSKKQYDHVANLPLDDDTPSIETTNKKDNAS